MKRRQLLKAGLAFLSSTVACLVVAPALGRGAAQRGPDFWQALAQKIGDRLKPVEWPLDDCIREPQGAGCKMFFDAVPNPYFLGDHPGLTQTFGWTGAWFTQPSDMVVEALSAADVAEAMKFARMQKVRLAVKGGGHSYKGGSNSSGSLLIWTRRMNAIVVHDAFVPSNSSAPAVPAVSVGAGAIWGDVYRAVAVERGRYVQGGGCLTVSVAGLVHSGGFGSFSKCYGLAAASLLEAEVVTADGTIRIVNADRDPDLFFALKGGGGGTFGIATRLTLKTYDLPATFGAVFLDIRASTAQSFRMLVARMIDFYADALFNPYWGEQIRLRPDNTLSISMVFQGLTKGDAEQVWASFLEWVGSRPEDYRLASDATILAVPAQSFWDADFLQTLPGVVLSDSQPGARKDRIFWASNREEAGQVIHAYRSTWLPANLLEPQARARLVDGLVAASRNWSISLTPTKGWPARPRRCAMRPPPRRSILPQSIRSRLLSAQPKALPLIPGSPAMSLISRRQNMTPAGSHLLWKH